MRFDRFLSALFSRKTLIMILVVLIAMSCLTACDITLEDVFCLAFCGCLSLGTCQKLLQNCDCSCDGGYRNPDGEYVDCERSNCIGEAYNGCFGCIWEGGLKNCKPSDACDSCEGEAEDEYDGDTSCDGCMIGCIDSCLYD